ncbi:MAG TPA: SigB/SigF/SigG family RNA polymerase sigma factor [Candidatus Dormibacteraeota bacterium]|jgi:RNA polymerase sigma-B factor
MRFTTAPDMDHPVATAPGPRLLPLRGAASHTERSRPDREESNRLLAHYAAGRDEAIRDRIVELNADLVGFVARRFANRGEPLEDLVQVGYVGLIQAIDRFDPARGCEFGSFAAPTIMGEIRRHFRDRSWAVRVPRRLRENYCRAMRAKQQLTQELGHGPSVLEISERIGIAPDEVLAALEAAPARRTVSLDATPRGWPGEEERPLADRIGSEDGNLERVETRALLGEALDHLSPRERQIMELRFVDQLPQVEVGRRMGISQMHVSRLQRAALDALRHDLGEVAGEDGAGEQRPRVVAGGKLGTVAGGGPRSDPPSPTAPDRPRPTLRWVPVERLTPRGDQPRRTIAEDSLTELTESIRRCGILQPLRVRQSGEEHFEIIAGERRWSAARRLQLREVPALVVQTDEEGAFIESLTENIQREALNAVDRARALQRLRVSLGSESWEDVGRVIGITRRHVHYLLNVTRLPAEIQDDVRAGGLSEKQARALLLLRTSPPQQRTLWQRIVSENLSGEQALRLARSVRDPATTATGSLARVRAAIRTLTSFLSSENSEEARTVAVELEVLRCRIEAGIQDVTASAAAQHDASA